MDDQIIGIKFHYWDKIVDASFRKYKDESTDGAALAIITFPTLTWIEELKLIYLQFSLT